MSTGPGTDTDDGASDVPDATAPPAEVEKAAEDEKPADVVEDEVQEDYPAARRPSALTLTRVEMRKLGDTRAGFWLLLVIGGLSVVIAAIALVSGSPADRNVGSFLQIELIPAGLLLPVLGILTVTSEWSQRTALTTFTMVPHRGRVLAAKLAAAVVMSLGVVVIALVAAYLFNLVAVLFVEADGSWALDPAELGGAALFLVSRVVLGVAFGLLFLNSPISIVLFFALPTVWAILGSAIPDFESVAAWLDITQRTASLVDPSSMGGQEWGQLGTSSAVWILLPLLLGTWRLLRREVR